MNSSVLDDVRTDALLRLEQLWRIVILYFFHDLLRKGKLAEDEVKKEVQHKFVYAIVSKSWLFTAKAAYLERLERNYDVKKMD